MVRVGRDLKGHLISTPQNVALSTARDGGILPLPHKQRSKDLLNLKVCLHTSVPPILAALGQGDVCDQGTDTFSFDSQSQSVAIFWFILCGLRKEPGGDRRIPRSVQKGCAVKLPLCTALHL